MPSISERRHLCRPGIMNYRLAVVRARVLRKLRIVQAIRRGQRRVAHTLDLVICHRLQGLLLGRLQQICVQLDLVNLLDWLLRVLHNA
jgi:hypothetical protein